MIPSTPKTRLKRIVEPLNAIQQKRQDFFTNTQQLYERLRHLANRTRTAVDILPPPNLAVMVGGIFATHNNLGLD
ncbi:hypothetical protein [Moraxella catarrhalis]|uniref:hypothetical protein n=2 Tax=Moraxella catarrhalis TaxID=480 RepID=UPI0002029CE1|nr:hypothetical protein [Moraxella catarrhalis]EGE22076.1 hypothetical protein E9S_01434 [Moraxella catarrhalis BC7]MPW49275.1 hypothetical protein [Moraxella catarrhalis]MPX12618.1 hypothetical protein [Moraxella catarrhalis]